ncbi:MAG: DUF3800 domain-containing protein [Nitrospirae bacterium]|nr:DUF3800 domain-containing protein [Nitrospirota bacterium]
MKELEKQKVSEILVYLDDSGTHNQSHSIVIGGCVALAKDWNLFVPEWQRILNEYQVSCHHNVDFAHSNGDYKSWNNEEKRISYIRSLIDIIGDVSWFIIGGVMSRNDYEDIVPPKFKEEIEDPYFFPFQMCIEGLMTVLTPEVAEDAKVDLIIDRQKGLSGKASKSFKILKILRDKNDRLGSIVYGDKKDHIPLQAADLIANEIYQDFVRTRPRRKSMEYLLSKVNPHVSYINRDGVIALIQDYHRNHNRIS